MIQPFQFSRIPQIVFGNGTFSRLVDLIKPFGTTICVITGARSFVNSEAWRKLAVQCAAHHIDIKHYPVETEPTVNMVDDISEQCRINKCKAVVAIGGGSVLDCGKAVSAMALLPETVKTYLEIVGSKIHPGCKLPFIAVPTTAGTGSEATKNTVIKCNAPEHLKTSLRHDNFIPDIALIDPELHRSCPGPITAACGMDALTHLIESHVSTGATPLSNDLALAGIRQIKDNLFVACKDGNDSDARSALAYGALLSGICLANAGLGVVHGLAGVIGGMYAIPHGVVCGTLLASATKHTIHTLRRFDPHSSALKKYAAIALSLSSTDITSDTTAQQCDKLIDLLYSYQEQLQMPSLLIYGINDTVINTIVQKTSSKNNPAALDQNALTSILKERL